MKRSIKIMLAITFLSVLITGCGKDEFSETETLSENQFTWAENQDTVAEGLSMDERFNELYYEKIKSQTEKNAIGLTNAQMLEDFDYLYQALRENYPYIGVAKRKAGADLDFLYATGREKLGECHTDADFYLEVSQFVDSMDGIGHLSLYGPSSVLMEIQRYQDLQKSEELMENQAWQKPWMEDFLCEAVVEHAEAWNGLLAESFQAAYNQVVEEFGLQQEEGRKNVQTKIIEEGKTAYVSIAAFDMDSYDDDKETLFSFYRQVSDYDNLIIDITQNGGGGMGYYMDLIVAPNIDRDVYWLNYVFLKDGPIIRKYHPDIEHDYFRLDTPVSEIKEQVLKWYPDKLLSVMEPFLENVGIPPKMSQEDLKDLSLFGPDVMGIESLDGNKMFKGKIWVLVSGNVYSSSESFASFCKTTGFATLVGNRTGGDGIGSDPLLFVLPNSGLVGRFAWIYGTVQDGRGSEEFGTEPDYPSREGESALDTCLRVIQ